MASLIFVSYSSKDREIVRKIVAPLEREVVVWWDRDLVLGDSYEPMIFKAIEGAAITIVVVSQSSVASDWVLRESQEALKCGARLIPIIIDGTPLPEHLKHLHAIDLTVGPVDETNPLLVGMLRDIRLLLDQTRERRTAAARQQLQRAAADVLDRQPDQPSESLSRRLSRAFATLTRLALIAYLAEGLVIGWWKPDLLEPEPTFPSLDVASPPLSPRPPVMRARRARETVIDHCLALSGDVICDANSQSGSPIVVFRSLEPSFIVETDEDAPLARLSQDGRFAESRAYLEQNFDNVSVSGRIILATMLDHGIGGERKQRQAFELLEQIVTETGDRAAKFNLGISHVFGRGTEPLPERGAGLIDAALREGFEPLSIPLSSVRMRRASSRRPTTRPRARGMCISRP
jgi:hypothetical protein